jgi:hypothetical protein
LYLAGILYVVNCSEWTRDGAYLATNAGVIRNNLGTGNQIDTNRIDWASLKTPSFITLSACVRYFFTRFMKFKYFDTGFGSIKYPVVFIATGHFTLKTTSAFICVDVQ